MFSAHATEMFPVGEWVNARYIVIPPATKDVRNTVVYMLLQSSPIPQTLQLQYHVAVQPVGSYFNIHNLVVFFWADPAENLKTHALTASYFPDKADKELIHSLSIRDGRVFADDQPFPQFEQPDPDFKGNKWMPVAQPK